MRPLFVYVGPLRGLLAALAPSVGEGIMSENAKTLAERWEAALTALREAHAAEKAMLAGEADALRGHIERIALAYEVFGPSTGPMSEAVEDAAAHIGKPLKANTPTA